MRIVTRHRWLLLAVVACGLLATGAYCLTRPRLSINEETCAKIRPGMTRAEVEGLIGGPPGDYTTSPRLRGGCAMAYEICDCWVSDEGEIVVEFDDGRVSQVRFGEVLGPSFLERLRTWLGW